MAAERATLGGAVVSADYVVSVTQLEHSLTSQLVIRQD